MVSFMVSFIARCIKEKLNLSPVPEIKKVAMDRFNETIGIQVEGIKCVKVTNYYCLSQMNCEVTSVYIEYKTDDMRGLESYHIDNKTLRILKV